MDAMKKRPLTPKGEILGSWLNSQSLELEKKPQLY
jgi:hypothetical protein